MFQRILAAVDGSAASKAGLRTAIGLARDQGATLIAVHVIDEGFLAVTPEASMYPPEYLEAMIESQKAAGRRLLDAAAASARAAGVHCETALARSRTRAVADAIVAQARKAKADVIVLGTHGRRGLRRVLMGSDAETVVREASVPVMLVRGSAAARLARTRIARR